MPLNFNFPNLEYLVGNADVVDKMSTVSPLRPFSDEVIDFLNDLSRQLMRVGKEFSDVATFGFWCRRSALLREKEKYADIGQRLGKGIIFHSTPSNVPVNFAFSFASGLLAGNANIVRLPGKPFTQVDLICSVISHLLEGPHSGIAPYICMVKYPPSKQITDAFSAICDSRVVWGGDGTIAEMRQSPLKSRANEITFADRHSIAVIQADAYLQAEHKAQIAQDFYNDTYFSDQNACTAPRLIVWIGQDIVKAQTIFWDHIHALVKGKYHLTPVQAVGKLHAFYKVAAQRDVHLVKSEDGFINRIIVDSIDEGLMQFKYNSGFFFEYIANNLCEIAPVCNERCQTLTYYGLSPEALNRFFTDCRPRGVDRAVPMGKSMDFTLVWDGHDLIRSLSRKINIL